MAQLEAADAAANENAAYRAAEQAAKAGSDILVFGADFPGPACTPDPLAALAREESMEMITGASSLEDGTLVESSFIDSTGWVPGFSVGSRLETYHTALGKTLVFPEAASFQAGCDQAIRDLRPRMVVMQASIESLLELEAVKELALSRSECHANVTVVVGRSRGRDGDESLGGSMVFQMGETVGETSTDQAELLHAEINPDTFVDYPELECPVSIPQLLAEKHKQ